VNPTFATTTMAFSSAWGHLRGGVNFPAWFRRAWEKSRLCYHADMTEDQIQAVLDRVRKWPRERQEDAAEMLMLIEEQDASPYHLTDGQAAEVERRRGDKSRKPLTLEEFDNRLRRFGA
jgi:hypothetical protein